jgi:DNA-binding Lrp family transcriptional regulator
MDELLQLLKRNALESPADLARMLNVSEKEVTERIAEYERAGIIRGYKAIVNEDQLDLDAVQATIEVRITPERDRGFDHVAQQISRFDEVQSLFLMSGGHDLLVFVRGATLKNVAFFVNEKLATIEGVLSTATHFVLKTYKQDGFLMQAEPEHERLQVSP